MSETTTQQHTLLGVPIGDVPLHQLAAMCKGFADMFAAGRETWTREDLVDFWTWVANQVDKAARDDDATRRPSSRG